MPNKIKQAVILSAGFGTRLKEVTGHDTPKAMVLLAGKPILEYHIERLRDYGVKEIFINLHYLPEKVTGYFGDGSKWGVKIYYCLEEPEIRGTAGGIKDFEGKLKGDFFVIYADMYNEMDYDKLAEAYYNKPDAIATEVVGLGLDSRHADMVLLGEDERFAKLYIRPHSGNVPEDCLRMKAIFVFNEKILPYIPANEYFEIDKELLPLLMSKGEKIYGYKSNDYVKDIGRPERHKEVEEYLNKKKDR